MEQIHFPFTPVQFFVCGVTVWCVNRMAADAALDILAEKYPEENIKENVVITTYTVALTGLDAAEAFVKVYDSNNK